MSTSAPFTMWLWIIGLSALFVGTPVLIVGTSVLISTRRSRRGPARQASQASQTNHMSQASQTVRRARIGRLGGLGLGALVGTVAFLAGFGSIALVLIAVGYLVGVLVAELRPATRPVGPIREASLRARSAWHYLPRWVVPVIVVATALALIAPVLFAAVPPPAGTGKGWLIAMSAPLTLIAVGALGALVLLLARLAALPQPRPYEKDGAVRDRANTARAIAGAVLGIELLALGGLAIVASSDVAGPLVTAGVAYTISRILVYTGQALGVAGLLAWAVLSRWRTAPAAPAAPADPPEAIRPGPTNPGPATPHVA